MIDRIKDGIRRWLIDLFVAAIVNTTRAEDRAASLQWLAQSRDVVSSNLPASEKLTQLHALVNSRTVATTVARSVAESVKNYRHSTLPWSMKVALPATLAAIPLIGAQGAGIAAFGGAIGVPVLLLVFLGTAGITAVIESVIIDPKARTDISKIIDIMIEDDRLRRASAEMKAAMREQPAEAVCQPMPLEEFALRRHLYEMDPFRFEQHVMGFFAAASMDSWVTKKSNDMGVDGFAVHPEGLMIVQCKRNAVGNKVGRPTVQQFKGVVEEQNAMRGYIVTTSTFTDEAKASALKSDKMALVDIDQLVIWHSQSPRFE